MAKARGTDPPEFKLRAVPMMTAQGLSVTEVARELGVSESGLHDWTKAVCAKGTAAFHGSGHQTPVEEELLHRRADVRRLEMARDNLTKPRAFFAAHAK